MQFLTFFPTVVFYKDIEESNENLLKYVRSLQQTDPGIIKSNVGGWHSDDQILLHHPGFTSILQIIADYAKESIQQFNWNFDLSLVNCWITVSPKGSSNNTHTHPGSLLSGVYYLQVDSNCSPLVLVDPRDAKVYSNPLVEHTVLTADKVSLTPKPGRLFLFPGWLPHYVPINESDTDRVVLSFNFVKG